MGRTYRGLSKKDKEKLKNTRQTRHKRELHDDESSFVWEKNRDRKKNVGRNVFDDLDESNRLKDI